LGVLDELFNRVETGVGDLRRLEAAHDLAGWKPGEHGGDLGIDHGAVLDAQSIPLEPRIIGERRPSQDLERNQSTRDENTGDPRRATRSREANVSPGCPQPPIAAFSRGHEQAPISAQARQRSPGPIAG